jgi:hypothetical protein
MPRFVILRHDSPQGVHFDLMLEAGDVLETWSLPQPPQANVEMLCEALRDHRLAYLDYEGPVAGDRGSVTRWDGGTFEMVEQNERKWILDVRGTKLVGRATLQASTVEPPRWSFRFSPSAICNQSPLPPSEA